MTLSEFNRRLKALNADGTSLRDQAACAVLVYGSGINEAARDAGIDPAAVSRRVGILKAVQICECCGQAKKIEEIKP